MNVGFVPQVNQFIEVNHKPARVLYVSEGKFGVEYFKTEWRNIPGLTGQIWEIFDEVDGHDEFVQTSGGRWRHKNRTLRSYGVHNFEYDLPQFTDRIRDAGLIFIKFGQLIYDDCERERRMREVRSTTV